MDSLVVTFSNFAGPMDTRRANASDVAAVVKRMIDDAGRIMYPGDKITIEVVR